MKEEIDESIRVQMLSVATLCGMSDSVERIFRYGRAM